jgi:hypothetical protein
MRQLVTSRGNTRIPEAHAGVNGKGFVVRYSGPLSGSVKTGSRHRIVTSESLTTMQYYHCLLYWPGYIEAS